MRVFEKGKTWDDARVQCRKYGGDLVINAYGEKTKKISELGQGTLQKTFWVGLNDKKVEGLFEWVDGTPLSTTNWAQHEPDDFGGNEDCIKFASWPHNLAWSDTSCNNMAGYVCEVYVDCDDNTFSASCREICSEHCAGPGRKCNKITRICTGGCNPGYLAGPCTEQCTNGTYGINCARRCSPHCAGTAKACNPVNGACLLGCDEGYHGDKCYQIFLGNHELIFLMAFLLPLIFIAFALMLTKKRGFSDDEIYSSFAEEAWESTPKVSLALTVYSITGKREAVIEQDAVRSQATNETGGRKSNAHHDDRVSSGYSVYSSYNSHISYASTE